MSEVADLLTELHDGDKTLTEVVAAFGSIKWAKGPAKPKDYNALMVADMGDPTPEVDGSFDEVTTAYALGQIDDKQYAALAKAAAGKGKTAGKPAADKKAPEDAAPDASKEPPG